jgi:hypothetical protein
MRAMPDTDLDGWLRELFASIDSQETATFTGFLTPDAQFRFGSMPAVDGVPAITSAVDGFFTNIAGSQHSVSEWWRQDHTVVCRGEVNYRRHDGTEIALPFANFMRLQGDKIDRYLIYADPGPLFSET